MQIKNGKQKTVADYPIYDKYYYIVDYRHILKVRLMPYYFMNKNAAKRAIQENYGKRGKMMDVVRGNKLRKYFLVYKNGTLKALKYTYENHMATKQDRKNHRTMMRRRLRRMGLYARVKSNKKVWEEPGIIKAVKNKQKVATSPGTIAKVIQIERKPKRWYYLVLEKQPSKTKGKLFKINALRFDNDTGKMKQVVIETLRVDILIPYLITELEHLVYEKIKKEVKTVRYYQRYGFGLR